MMSRQMHFNSVDRSIGMAAWCELVAVEPFDRSGPLETRVLFQAAIESGAPSVVVGLN